MPKSNRAWWEVKLASITERDRRTDGELLAARWLPLRIWEHEDAVAAVDRLEGVMLRRRAELRVDAVTLGEGLT